MTERKPQVPMTRAGRSAIPAPWEPTEAELAAARDVVWPAVIKAMGPSVVFAQTVRAILNAAGPLIAARALREAAEIVGETYGGRVGTELLLARAAALEAGTAEEKTE